MSSVEMLVKLLKDYGTVRELSEFLKERGLRGASSWDQVIDERVIPALKTGKLSEDDLLALVGELEEYGYQHVFLFRRAAGGGALPTKTQLENWLSTIGASDAFESPILVGLPKHPTVAQVRRDQLKAGEVLVTKVIETRRYETFVGTTELGGGRFVREYRREELRAVNVVRIHTDGLVEFRVHRHRTGAASYADDLNQLMLLIADIVDPTSLQPVHLVKAKRELYARRHELEGVISFSSTLIRHSDGINVTAACGRQRSLFAHDTTERSLATLVSDGEAYHDAHNIWWLKQEKKRPSQDIHVILSGEPNEFVVTQRCSRGDYEHVLSEIRRFNK